MDSENISPHLALARRLAKRFSAFPMVEAVALGGSLASGAADAASDIDLYIFTTGLVPLAARAALVEDLGASRADLDLRFWDLGDEWIDRASGIEVDLIYWDTAWIQDQLDRVLVRHEAWMGYTTCFWHTLRGIRGLYDRSGWLAALQQQANQPYPEELRHAILEKNIPVLRQVIPSYAHQIARAARRADWVSVNHRVAALLASYFDVLFAFNRQLHPGEKRLVALAAALCPQLPVEMASQIEAVLQAAAPGGQQLVEKVDQLIDGLEKLVAGP